MTRPRDSTYIWVTWLAKLIAGEVSCDWSIWYRARFEGYTRAPSDFQLAVWTAEHNALLTNTRDERRAQGHDVFVEAQNNFKLQVTERTLLAGKADLVTLSRSGVNTVYDFKTGSPRKSDVIQVMLYMLCLPYGSDRHKGRTFDGCVVYKDGSRTPIPASATDPSFRKLVRLAVNRLDVAAPPPRAPSSSECRFCDLTLEDCPERLEWSMDPAPVPVLDLD